MQHYILGCQAILAEFGSGGQDPRQAAAGCVQPLRALPLDGSHLLIDMTRRGNPTQIGGLIRNITSQLVAGQPLYAIWQVWEGATGEVVAKHARPVRLRDGLLIVAVDSSTWMQELHYLKPQLCTKLTEAVPEAAVKDLYFVLREDDSEPASRPILKGEDRLPPPPRIAHPSSPTSPEAARGKPLDDILKRWLEVARKGRRES